MPLGDGGNMRREKERGKSRRDTNHERKIGNRTWELYEIAEGNLGRNLINIFNTISPSDLARGVQVQYRYLENYGCSVSSRGKI